MSTRPQAVGTVQIDDARMRVTEWRFAPGAATGFHRHAHDYCVVPLTTGTLRIESKDGVSEAPLVAGRSYTARRASSTTSSTPIPSSSSSSRSS